MGKKEEQSKKTYDKMAREYDSSPEGKYTRAHKAGLLERVAVKDGYNILDVACGNGALLAELSKKANVNSYGIDISERMIEIARRRYPDCQFRAQPCLPLGFESGYLDVITVCCAFHHFENPAGFAAECMRALKDGGTVYMAEPRFGPVVRQLANALVFPFSRRGDVRVYSQRELTAFFENAGFYDVTVCAKDSALFLRAKKRRPAAAQNQITAGQ